MRKTVLFSCLLVLLATSVSAIADGGTKLLRFPDYAEGRIVFVYQNDLWIVQEAGGLAHRLTAFDGVESMPKFSPDGNAIAFNGQYYGNTNVYVLPLWGGEPVQVTFHPEDDSVVDWTPDGKSILFTSGRNSPVRFFNRFFEIALDGTAPVELPVDQAGAASYSPDGSKMVLNRHSFRYWWWKRYKGSANTDIWIMDRSSGDLEQISDWNGQDSWPMWAADGNIYFVSERDGTANIYSINPSTRETQKITNHETDGVQWPSIGSTGRKIVYECEGKLWLLDIASRESGVVEIVVRTDHHRPMVEWINPFEDYFVEASIGPSGKRVIVEARGEIFSLPVENGETRNLTNSPGARDREPAWSPNGQYIAFVSDQDGEYEIYLVDQKGKGESQQLTDTGEFKFGLTWSPDSKKLLYFTNEHDLMLIDLESKIVDRAAKLAERYERRSRLRSQLRTMQASASSDDRPQDLYGALASQALSESLEVEMITRVKETPKGVANIREPKKIAGSRYANVSDYDWSPDSKWIAYIEPLRNDYTIVRLYSLESGESTAVTAGDARESDVAFDNAGKRLYWLSYGRAYGGFRYNAEPQRLVMSAGLAPEEEEPFVKAEDEEPEPKPVADEESKQESKARGQKPEEEKPEEEKAEAVKVVLDGIAGRIRALPIPAGNYSSLDVSGTHVYYLERTPGSGFRQGSQLQAWSLKDQKTTTILPNVQDYELNSKGDKVLYYDGRNLGVAGATSPAKAGAGKIDTSNMRMRLDRRAEWNQIYEEAWRMVRDWFYDDNHHGVDWQAIGDFYRSLMPYVTTRYELSLLLSELVGELNASHQGARGNPDVETVPSVNIALLGAVLEPDMEAGYWRIKSIYQGDKTEQRFRAPLYANYVKVKEGDYLLKIDGQEIKADDNYLKYLIGRDNGTVTITTNAEPTLEGAIETRISPVTSESNLRYKRWIDGNRAKVERLGGGKIGYVHLPDMVFGGLVAFNRAFTEFRYRDGLILDCRFNGGGGIDPILIDMLERQAYQVTRTRDYDADMRPSDGFYGHVVVLINEHSYSDAEVFPSAFQVRKLGTVIGIPTLGFVIAVGPYQLIDNGVVRRTTTGLWDVLGNQLESRGAIPDIEVRNPPKETYHGGDAQLEAAVNHLLRMIAEHPVPRPEDYKQEIEPR